MRLRMLALVACCIVAVSPVRAAPLDDLERQLRDVIALRQTSERERLRLIRDAATLADGINAAQAPGEPTARATASLQRQLRDFDRVATQLDASDRAIKNHDATIARLRRAIGTELDKLTRELSQADTRSSAAQAAELDAARRRIDGLVAPPAAFRPLLVVRPAETDTVVELDQKLAVLAAEQARGTEAVITFDQELAVLGGRTVVTRRLLDDLERVARAAPPDLRLVQRQVDEVQARLRDLNARDADMRRLRAAIVGALSELDVQVKECRSRRAVLVKG